jgi:hypothetical protein
MPRNPNYGTVAERARHRCQYCLAPERIFNKEWDEHFRIVILTGVIEGKRPVGRGTVERLGMNRKLAWEARQVWIAPGLFP